MKKFNFKKSFTLVELMIVIAVLAILSAIVIFVLNPSRLVMQFNDSVMTYSDTDLKRAIKDGQLAICIDESVN